MDSQNVNVSLAKSISTFATIYSCSIHSSCSDCHTSIYSCGWCVLQNQCTDNSHCSNDEHLDDAWLQGSNCPSINSISPTQFLAHSSSQLTIKLDNVPDISNLAEP